MACWYQLSQAAGKMAVKRLLLPAGCSKAANSRY